MEKARPPATKNKNKRTKGAPKKGVSRIKDFSIGHDPRIKARPKRVIITTQSLLKKIYKGG